MGWCVQYLPMFHAADEQLDWLCDRIPEHPHHHRRGGLPVDRPEVAQGKIEGRDSRANGKVRIGSKASAHRRFRRTVEQGRFEATMRDAGQVIEARRSMKLDECFVGSMVDVEKVDDSDRLVGELPRSADLLSEVDDEVSWFSSPGPYVDSVPIRFRNSLKKLATG